MKTVSVIGDAQGIGRAIAEHFIEASNQVAIADIAHACLFLTAPANNFIIVENMAVDGGMTKKMIYEP